MAKKKRYVGTEAVLQIEWRMEESVLIEAEYQSALKIALKAKDWARFTAKQLQQSCDLLSLAEITGRDFLAFTCAPGYLDKPRSAANQAAKKADKANRRVTRAKEAIDIWLTQAVKSGLEHSEGVDEAILNRFKRRQYDLSRLTLPLSLIDDGLV